MTRVAVIPADESACGLYRMRFPAGAVRQARPDWQVDLFRPADVKLGSDVQGNLQQVQGLPHPSEFDLLIMQRVATRAQAQFVKWARNFCAVITDSDDAMWAIDSENSSFPYWNSAGAHWRWLDDAAETADLTTVTTAALAKRYGKHGRCEVLPNCVPADLSHTLESVRASLDPRPTVGWAGFTATHPRDLTVCGEAVKQAQEDTGCLVRVVGDAQGAAMDWGMPSGSVEQVQPTPVGLPYYTALTSLDIGLVPLLDSPFNRAKSYLKALEYAACGVAVIASPTPAILDLARTVPIILAGTPTAWYDAITFLVNDPEARTERAAKAQAAVWEHHTYEGNAEGWAAAWERAMTRHQRMTA